MIEDIKGVIIKRKSKKNKQYNTMTNIYNRL